MRIGYSSGGGVAALPVADGELDVGAVSQALWRRKWLILIPTLAVAVGTWAFVNTLTPRYGSEARVLIDVHENVFLRPEADKTAPDRAALDDQGRWVEDGRLRNHGPDDPTRRVIASQTFVKNVGVLSAYLAATRSR